MLELVRSVRRPDVHVSIVPRYYEIFTSNATLDDLEGVPMVSLPRSTRPQLARAQAQLRPRRRAAPAPPARAAAGRRRACDPTRQPGPVFYRQAAARRDGSTFRIVKFRTMYVDAEPRRQEVLHLNDVDGPLFKIK